MEVDDDVEVVDEVDVVEAAVVTGVVVVVTAGVDDDVVTSTSDDVEPELAVVDESLLQPAIANVTRTKGTMRVDFTPEVWHARSRLPDQGVGLVTTFNKL